MAHVNTSVRNTFEKWMDSFQFKPSFCNLDKDCFKVEHLKTPLFRLDFIKASVALLVVVQCVWSNTFLKCCLRSLFQTFSCGYPGKTNCDRQIQVMAKLSGSGLGLGFLRKLDLMTTPVKVCRAASGRAIKGPGPQEEHVNLFPLAIQNDAHIPWSGMIHCEREIRIGWACGSITYETDLLDIVLCLFSLFQISRAGI